MKGLLDVSEARERLEAGGLRVTSQRLLVLQILARAEAHLDAEGIYNLAREQGFHVSLATVYRTLSRLKETGLVDQRFFGPEHKREYYEAADKAEHYHFVCLSCGKVVEVNTPRIAQARRELAEEYGLVLAAACTCFEGYCAECAAESGKGKARGHGLAAVS